MSRPTVAHVMPEYLSRTATYIYNTVRLQERHAPVVLTEQLANLGEYPLDAPILKLPPHRGAGRRDSLGARLSGYRSAYEQAISREVAQRNCTLIHAHHGWSGRLAVAAARRNGLPLVTTYYGRDLAMRKRRREVRGPYDLLFRHGSRFICEGPAMAEHLFRLGCPAEKIRLVRIGIELERFPFQSRTRSRPLIFMQAARFMPKKGFDLTLRAFAQALPRLGSSELWLVGDGELRPELETLAEALGLESSVRFLGAVSYDEYQDLITRAHVCIQPSRVAPDGDTEGGAPTVLLEMQAIGVPVIATRHADIPFVLHDDEYLVVEEDVDGLASALERIAAIDEHEYRARAEAARAHVEWGHNVWTMASSIEDVYAETTGVSPDQPLNRLEMTHA